MKLWVIGEKSPNPEEWNRVKDFSLIIAESAERAIQCAGHGINEFVTEVNMTLESGIFYRGTMNVPKKNRVQVEKGE